MLREYTHARMHTCMHTYEYTHAHVYIHMHRQTNNFLTWWTVFSKYDLSIEYFYKRSQGKMTAQTTSYPQLMLITTEQGSNQLTSWLKWSNKPPNIKLIKGYRNSDKCSTCSYNASINKDTVFMKDKLSHFLRHLHQWYHWSDRYPTSFLLLHSTALIQCLCYNICTLK